MKMRNGRLTWRSHGPLIDRMGRLASVGRTVANKGHSNVSGFVSSPFGVA